MLAALGHEFSTPLAVIAGYTSTLLSHREHLAPQEQDEFLQMIQHAGRRLDRLTRQLLEIAQLEAGMIELDNALVDVSALARAAIAQAERQVPEPLRDRVTFALHCRKAPGQPLGAPPLVKGDVQRLRQLLEQLLENAVRYSPAGGRVDVIIQPAPHAPNADVQSTDGPESFGETAFWEICVCDMGLGIPEEYLERVFAPFYRVDAGLTREQYGLGLGLTACKLLVDLHQGRIWAESCPEGGSAFHVWLPRDGTISTV
jgi:signal transduction histidine kinase